MSSEVVVAHWLGMRQWSEAQEYLVARASELCTPEAVRTAKRLIEAGTVGDPEDQAMSLLLLMRAADAGARPAVEEHRLIQKAQFLISQNASGLPRRERKENEQLLRVIKDELARRLRADARASWLRVAMEEIDGAR